MVLAGCETSTETIRIMPPDATEELDLIILRGRCPSDEELTAGAGVCGRLVLHRESIRRDGMLVSPANITGEHAVLVVASTGCNRSYACVSLDGPGPVNLTPADFGASREECEPLACPTESDAGVDGPLPLDLFVQSHEDEDEDGVINCIECTEGLFESCDIEQIPRERCELFNGDGDSEPDYRDRDSDNDGYPDGWECPNEDPAEPARLCDHDNNNVPDQREAQSDEDYDGDGISNMADCDGAESFLDCPDTADNGDGLNNARDLDSDGDGRSDRDECPDPPACRDTGGVPGVPDFLDAEDGPTPSGCDCAAMMLDYSCMETPEGICFQTDITVGAPDLMLAWSPSQGELLAERIELDAFLSDLGDPDMNIPDVWRCIAGEPCGAGRGVAVGVIERDSMTTSYVYVDMREPAVAGAVPEVDSPLRVGRFVYGPGDDGTITTIVNSID